MKKFYTRFFQNEKVIATLVIASVFLLTAILSIWVYSIT